MLYQKYEEKNVENGNGTYENIKVINEIYYDEKNVLKCPNCNNMIFYIENKMSHKCPFNQNYFVIDEKDIKNKSNKFLCEINKIENLCVKHKKEFLYYKNSNYFCSECLRENNLKDYLILDFIRLSKEEINNFNQLIKDSEKLMEQIKEMNENYIKKLKESYENFAKKNKLLIEYCKNLLKFNEKYDKNYNLISTIRRISIDININDFKVNENFN